MTAYIVKEPYGTVDADGVNIVIPKGARVEEGNYFLEKSPEMWQLDEPVFFQGRAHRGLTVIPQGEGAQAKTVELSTGAVQEQPSMENIVAWLDAEDRWKEEQLALEAEAAAKAKTTSGVKRSLPRAGK